MFLLFTSLVLCQALRIVSRSPFHMTDIVRVLDGSQLHFRIGIVSLAGCLPAPPSLSEPVLPVPFFCSCGEGRGDVYVCMYVCMCVSCVCGCCTGVVLKPLRQPVGLAEPYIALQPSQESQEQNRRAPPARPANGRRSSHGRVSHLGSLLREICTGMVFPPGIVTTIRVYISYGILHKGPNRRASRACRGQRRAGRGIGLLVALPFVASVAHTRARGR